MPPPKKTNPETEYERNIPQTSSKKHHKYMGFEGLLQHSKLKNGQSKLKL